MTQGTGKRTTIVIGVCLPKEVYEQFAKRVPRSKRDRSKIITALLKKFLQGDVVIQTTY